MSLDRNGYAQTVSCRSSGVSIGHPVVRSRQLRLRKGIPRSTIEVAQQGRCIRPTCILRCVSRPLFNGRPFARGGLPRAHRMKADKRRSGRDKQKIVARDGDEDLYNVDKIIGYILYPSLHFVQRSGWLSKNEETARDIEKLIGRPRRRAIGRAEDGVTRVFEYLLLWTGYPIDEATW